MSLVDGGGGATGTGRIDLRQVLRRYAFKPRENLRYNAHNFQRESRECVRPYK